MHTIPKSTVTKGADGAAVLLDRFLFKIFRTSADATMSAAGPFV